MNINRYEYKIIYFPFEIHTSSARLPLDTFKHRTSKRGYLSWNASRSLLEGPQSELRDPALQIRFKTKKQWRSASSSNISTSKEPNQ